MENLKGILSTIVSDLEKVLFLSTSWSQAPKCDKSLTVRELMTHKYFKTLRGVAIFDWCLARHTLTAVSYGPASLINSCSSGK